MWEIEAVGVLFDHGGLEAVLEEMPGAYPLSGRNPSASVAGGVQNAAAGPIPTRITGAGR